MDLRSHMKDAPLSHEAVFTKPVPTGNTEKAKDTKGTKAYGTFRILNPRFLIYLGQGQILFILLTEAEA